MRSGVGKVSGIFGHRSKIIIGYLRIAPAAVQGQIIPVDEDSIRMRGHPYHNKGSSFNAHILVDVNHGQERPLPQVPQDSVVVYQPLIPVVKSRMLGNQVPFDETEDAQVDPMNQPGSAPGERGLMMNLHHS